MSAPAGATPPARLGKYPIERVLGEGAMGVVYLARDPVIERPVAIKTIRHDLASDAQAAQEFAERFRNEARAVGRLSHPGIVTVYEFGETPECSYIVMEYVEGRSLDQVLRQQRQLPPAEACRIVDGVLSALACAHEHGVWHRDVKPGNVLISVRGEVKLTDFGIARIESAALTQVAASIGTPGYMAPEQYRGEGLGPRTDLFSAGVLLVRLLTGRMPFAGAAEALMYQVLHGAPQLPGGMGLDPALGAFDALLARALAKDPQERPASAEAFRADLSGCLARLEQGAGAVGGPWSGTALEATVVPATAVPAAAVPATAVPATAVPAAAPPATAVTPAVERLAKALTQVLGPVGPTLVRRAARTTSDPAALRELLRAQLGDDEERRRFDLALAQLEGAVPAADLTAGPPGAGADHHQDAPTLPSGAPAARPGTAVAGSDASLAGTAGAAVAPAGTLARGGAVTGAGSTGGNANPAISGERPVDAALLAAAQAMLTDRLGPIARLLVRKAAAQADSADALVAALLAQLEPQDRAAVEPLLRRL